MRPTAHISHLKWIKLIATETKGLKKEKNKTKQNKTKIIWARAHKSDAVTEKIFLTANMRVDVTKQSIALIISDQ